MKNYISSRHQMPYYLLRLTVSLTPLHVVCPLSTTVHVHCNTKFLRRLKCVKCDTRKHDVHAKVCVHIPTDQMCGDWPTPQKEWLRCEMWVSKGICLRPMRPHPFSIHMPYMCVFELRNVAGHTHSDIPTSLTLPLFLSLSPSLSLSALCLCFAWHLIL